MIPDIGNVDTTNINVVPHNNVGISGIRNVRSVNNRHIRGPYLKNANISDTRIWLREPPQALPKQVPVTVIIGKPIVNMPGCVKVNKENTGRDPSKNKQLVNDDPDQNVVLCDGGMPYYQPPDYQSNQLTWTTVYPEQEPQTPKTQNKEPPPPDTTPPQPPVTPPTTSGDIPCPPPNARRIGDLNQAGTERVKEYKLIQEGTICETVWEPIPFVDKYLPSPAVVTTTATIAAVATTSALLAKPLADLLLKVVKPVVKKAIGKVKALMGKKEPVLSQRDRVLAQRERNRAVMELRKALKK